MTKTATSQSHIPAPTSRARDIETLASLGVRIALLVLGVGVAIATQSSLSVQARTGIGVAQLTIPTEIVAFSLVAPALVVGILRWSDLMAGARAGVVRVSAFLNVDRYRLGSDTATIPAHLADNAAHAFRNSPRPRITSTFLARIQTFRILAQHSKRMWVTLVSAVLAVVISIMADLAARVSATRPLGQWEWLVSVGLLLVAAWNARRRKQTLPSYWSAVWTPWRLLPDGALLLLLLIGALVLRLPSLTTLPYPVHGDEAANGLEALRWLHGQIPSLLDVGWYGLPVAGYGLPALIMRVAGASLFGLRLSSVLIGILSIIATYGLGREFGGRRFAFLAAAILTVEHAHVQFSRMGIHYIHAVAVVTVTLWLLVHALRVGSARAAVGAAIGMSLAAQVYPSARILFVIVPAFLLIMLLCARPLLTKQRHSLGWFVLGTALTLGPLATYFAVTPGLLFERTQQVSIVAPNADVRIHLISQFGTAALGPVLSKELAAVPLYVGGLADQSLQYGAHAALFDPVTAALVTIGFLLALTALRRQLNQLLVIWVAATVVGGGLLTIDQPWWPRLIVMLPVLCLLAASSVEALAQYLSQLFADVVVYLTPEIRVYSRSVLVPGIGVILASVTICVGLISTWQHYFVEYPQLVNVDPSRTRFTDIGFFAGRLPPGTHVILFTHDDIVLSYDTIHFLAPELDGQTVHTSAAVEQALWAYPTHTAVIIMPSAAADFSSLLAQPNALPPGSYRPYMGVAGKLSFTVYDLSGTAR